MAEKEQSKQPTHKVYTVVKREGQDDFWLNLGLAFPHKDGKGFSVFTNAWPHDGKIVCREIAEDDQGTDTVLPLRQPQSDRQGSTGRGKR